VLSQGKWVKYAGRAILALVVLLVAFLVYAELTGLKWRSVPELPRNLQQRRPIT
jgi:hypothetical protein